VAQGVAPVIDERVLREQLVLLLEGTEAHMGFEEAVADFPDDAINARAPNVPYSAWHLAEHVRITQWDILEYVRDPEGHVSPRWPTGYWPARDAEATPDVFRRTVEGFLADRAALAEIVRDPATDLTAVLRGTPGHTVVREVTVVGNHNSYHLGEFAILRQVMRTWPKSHR
jgi:hypothetical protein